MRWTQTFIPTVKEVPADAEVLSHQLMLRAGLIRKLASGTYTYLPLGYRALRKAIDIVRREMDAAGAIEINMPVLQPIELWEKTGRVKDYGANLMVVTDRHGRRNALGPTHEEVVTSLVADHVSSYRQLPVTLYQIQTKFRDEFRPRFGVLRSREFLMKDAYSFDADKAGLDVSYQKMYDAYCRIFSLSGLRAVAVEAESGPIGGDASHEFMVPTDAGEDVLIQCAKCGYAANQERAELGKSDPRAEARGQSPLPTPPPEGRGQLAAAQEVHTPGTTTIEQVSNLLKLPATKFIKTMIYVADGGKRIVGLVRGDHELNEAKLARAAGVPAVTMAEPDVIGNLTGAAVGFAGPQGLANRDAVIVADLAVMDLVNAVSGANKTDYHLTNVNPGRDFTPTVVADIRIAQAGDACARCGGTLTTSRGIEVGHVFKLGTKYSAKLGAKFEDEAGALHEIVMGCYGIGVNRILASAIEAYHDDKGIIWPISIAPYQVLIVPVGADRSEQVRTVSEKLYAELCGTGGLSASEDTGGQAARGTQLAGPAHNSGAEDGPAHQSSLPLGGGSGRGAIDVLIDDRDARPGVKFNDADLIGIPIRVTIGEKALKAGNVELKLRREANVQLVPLADALKVIRETVDRLFAELK